MKRFRSVPVTSNSRAIRRGVLPLLLMVGFSLVVVMSSFPSITGTGPNGSLASPRILKNTELTSGTAPAYSPGELWGGGNPDEACDTCTTNELLGESGGQSLQGSQSIDPASGDFTTSKTLFDVTTTGDSLDTTLTYSSELAEAEASASAADGTNFIGYFSWGWESTINYSATNNAFGQVTLNEPNGSTVEFSPATSDGCGTGDYQDFQKYTTTDSYLPWCATSRLDAQLGSMGGIGYKLTEGNGDVSGYSWTGQLGWSGTQEDHTALTYAYNIPPGTDNCPTVGTSSCYTEADGDGKPGDPGVRWTTTAIDTFGFIGEVIDPSGQSWSMAYSDGSGDLTSIVDAATGFTNNYVYNTTNASPLNHEMGQAIDPNGNATTLYYTTYGMAYNIQSPAGGSTNYTYSNNTCATTTGCVGLTATQDTEVSYENGENDFDNYVGGVLVADSFGPGTSLTDSRNQYWQFNYTYPGNGYGWTTKAVILPDGHTATIVTDGVGNVVSYTDPNGNTTHSMYNDSAGNDLDELCWTAAPGVPVPSNSSCTDPPAGSTSYTYDAYGHELSEKDPLGNTSFSGYYNNGELCWTSEATVGNGSPCNNGGTTPNGAPTGSTVYTYYQGNQILKTIAYNTAYAQTSQATYDTDSELVYTLPPDGGSAGGWGSNPYETRNYYYSYGFLQQTVAPFGRTTSYAYDPDGNITYEADPAGITTTTYDADDRVCWTLRSLTAPTGPTCSVWPTGGTIYGYVLNTDNVSTQIDPNGHATTYAFTDLQHPSDPTLITDAMSAAITFKAYNLWGESCLTGPGNPASPTCPTSAAATPLGDSSSLLNDEGQLTSTTDPKGETTTYAYTNPAFPTDATSMTNPLGKVTSYTYDADGDQVSATDPAGNVMTTAYDADGRICYSAPVATTAACSTPPSGTGVTVNTWNAADERSQMVDNYNTSSSATSLYAYDADGNLTSSTDDNGRTVGYTYDVAGEVSCIAYPVLTGPNCANAPSSTNSVVDRSYDGAGRLSLTTDWLGNTITFGGYNQNSQLGQIVYPSSVNETLNYGYDNAGNLLSANYTGGTSGSNSWTYNADEQQASTSQLGTFASPTDTYNDYKQVTTASNPTGTGSVSDTYTTAANGELQADQATGRSAINLSYNGGAQLTSMTNPNLPAASADTTYAYTADGQRCWSNAASTVTSGAACGSAPTGATSYQWNAKGQLCWSGQSTSTSSCSAPPTGVTTYSYDGNGLRMTETPPSGSALKFSWDMVDGGLTPLMVDDGTNAYIYGETLFGGTAPIEQINLTTDAASFISAIPSGVQDVFSNSGSVLEKAAYSTYGTQTIEAGSSVTPFGFQGSYTDATGLIYLINRYYDPSTYQFLSIDPKVSTTMQPYAFVGGDPLNATDPLGLDKVYLLRRYGRTYYVGRTNDSARRTREHIRRGLLDPKKGETFEELDTENLGPLQTRGVEQIAMDTLKRTGEPLANKMNSISPRNGSYPSAIEEGNEALMRSPKALLQINDGNASAAAQQFERMMFQNALELPRATGASGVDGPGGESPVDDVPPDF
ncbi:MAG: RHS repeat-associated core domain-containing protein [Acidimicrobiales bacterium]|jgi:RHS repeat-associated protein